MVDPINVAFLMSFFFFNDTATTEIYTLSLHDALPISHRARIMPQQPRAGEPPRASMAGLRHRGRRGAHERQRRVARLKTAGGAAGGRLRETGRAGDRVRAGSRGRVLQRRAAVAVVVETTARPRDGEPARLPRMHDLVR